MPPATMDQLSALAASGLRSRMESLDMLSNNLANATTAGYKADREYYGLYVGAGTGLDSADPLASKFPVIESQWTDYSQGLLEPTGNPTDLALSGKGFFSVKGPNGPLYTRGGSFQVSTAGWLTTTKDGYPLLSDEGQPIKLSPDLPFEITPEGSVMQSGQPVGTLAIVDFADVSALSKQSGTLFKNMSSTVKPIPAVKCTVHQGKLEASNTGTAEATVRLVGVMRQYEIMQKAIGVSSEMNRKAIEEVARVS
jgi:flagellar basal-body rod protein FlgF